MLFRPPGGDALERVQGAWVSDPDIQKVVDFVSGQVEQSFDQKVLSEESAEGEGGQDDEGDDGVDEAPSSEFANSIAAKYLESATANSSARPSKSSSPRTRPAPAISSAASESATTSPPKSWISSRGAA
jgi:DNA segregation ATPase FtsK/SpoIIIE-like protein